MQLCFYIFDLIFEMLSRGWVLLRIQILNNSLLFLAYYWGKLKNGETFASLLNIHSGDICVVPTHLVQGFKLAVSHGNQNVTWGLENVER